VSCGAYHALGDLAKAQQECDTALALVRKDPQYGPVLKRLHPKKWLKGAG